MLQVTPKNVRVVMQTMKVGDGFFLSAGREGLHIVHEVNNDKVFTLKTGLHSSPKIGADYKPVSHQFTVVGHDTQQVVTLEVGSRTGHWSNFHSLSGIDTDRFPIYVPREDVQHALRLDELERELANVDALHTARVEEARRKVQTAERVRMEVLRKNLSIEHELMMSYRKELDQSAQFAREPGEHPDAKAVALKIQETEEKLKTLLERGFCPIPEQGLIEAAYDLHGLGFRQIATLLLDTRLDNVPLTRKEILATRIELLRQAYGHLFDVVEPMYGFEGIGGLDDIKAYFTEVRDAILRKEYRAVPMGTLLMGPPGTGKTAVAEALARECGFLYVKVKSTKSMWVGESERIIAEMFLALRELAPVIVLRDEVDRTDIGRDQVQGDSGVSAHQQGAWMQFLSDPAIRGQIFVISCTNRPDLLDAALKRAGRTDERIPVLMPDEATRAAVFAVMAKRYAFPYEIESFDPFAKLTAGRSGADIEVIVRRAYQRAVTNGGDKITSESLAWSIEDYIDNASNLEVARMTMIALRSASSKRFLPKNMEEIVTQCMQTLATELGGVLVTDAPVATPEASKDDKAN
ncbi:MAG: AAA family ATPase [Candidatus Uhrbacteria bacterium]|nr:AAA family ATPase [Candidatus Uhrbacteria bacterium]